MIKDKKTYHILIIEDNLGDFILIQDYLEEQIAAPQITHVKSFKEAKSSLSYLKINYDVILLDLSLPDKSGEALISETIFLCSECPVIALTGYEDIEFSVKSLAMGIADYLLKDDINASSLYKSIVFNIERKKTNLALEESEKRYSDLFHLSPQPMWVYALDTFRFQDVNEAAIVHYGYTREEFVTMSLTDLSPEESVDKSKKAKDGLFENNDEFVKQEIKHKKKNGAIILVEMQGRIVFFKGAKAEIIVVNDITERSRYIHEIQEQNKRLSEIAWMQSHVIRAPLARIMGLIDLLENGGFPPVENAQMLKHLLNSAHDLDNVIREISGKT